MANEDPIVAEVRAFRERHAARFDYDIGRICRDIRERQEEQKRLGQVFVRYPPRPTERRMTPEEMKELRARLNLRPTEPEDTGAGGD